MIGFDFKITNKNGDSIILNEGSQLGAHTDPLNVYALQKYPGFSKSIKNNEIARQGQIGVWDFYSYYGRLSLGFSGIIVAESHQKLEQMKAKMSKVFALPLQPTATNDGYVKIEWTDLDGINKFVEAKLTADITYDRGLRDQNMMSFLINLKTKTPYVFSGDGTGGDYLLETGVRGYQSSGGIFLPTLFPFGWGGTWQNKLTIDTSTANNPSYTKIKLYGEAQQAITNPVIANLTTGEQMQINVTLADETEWVEIDGYNGTILNQNGDDVSGFIVSGSSFVTLMVGINELIYLSDQNPYVTLLLPTAEFEVRYLQTYDS